MNIKKLVFYCRRVHILIKRTAVLLAVLMTVFKPDYKIR